MWLPIFVCFFRVCFVAWLLLLLPLLLQQHLDFMPPFMLVFIVESYLPRIKRLDKLFRSRKKQQLISLSFLFLSLLSRSHSLSLALTHTLSPLPRLLDAFFILTGIHQNSVSTTTTKTKKIIAMHCSWLVEICLALGSLRQRLSRGPRFDSLARSNTFLKKFDPYYSLLN